MSLALKKTCSCGKLIDYAVPYCKECQDRRTREKAARHRSYDRYIRNKETTAFYNSGEWEAVRTAVMRRYKGLDLYEYYTNNQIIYADSVHHIIELSEDWSRRLDVSNLMPLTQSNHSMIHKLYLNNKSKVQRELFSLLQRWEREFTG